jgi:chromosome segregation protein
MRGFKSFCDPVTLRFTKGFNAIVGPNGSGKSNITDGLSFVLGQLSPKTLRMESLADVIFDPTIKGSTSAKEQKPSKYARVTLTLDNSDKAFPDPSETIKIARQVDRTGTSIYLVNGKRVTRSDLTDFLSFAQLHPDGYNLIPQGKIASIVNMSQNQRRELIEEIAGISAYDLKKEKAKKELSKADMNLRQINILVSQNQKTLETLIDEREKALKYNTYEEEKRLLEGQVYTYQLSRSKKEILSLRKSVSEAEKNLTKLNAKKEAEEVKIQALREREKQEEEVLGNWREEQLQNRKEIGEVNGTISGILAEIKLLKRMITDSQGANKKDVELQENKKKSREKNRGRIRTLTDERLSIQDQLQEKQTESEDQRKKLRALEADRDKKLEHLKDAQRDFQSASDKHHATQTKLQLGLAHVEEIGRSLQKLRESRDSLKSKITQANQENRELVKNQATQKTSLEKLETRKTDLEEKLTTTQDELEKVVKAGSHAHEEHIKVDTRIRAIEGVKGVENNGGDAVNYIRELKRKGQLDGVLGVFSDFITAPEEYMNAIKTAAGSLFDALVVTDKAALDRVLQTLMNKPVGRVRFIVMDCLPKLTSQDSDSGKLKSIITLVQTPASLEKAASFVLGKSKLATSFKEAWGERKNHDRIVTPEGELIFQEACVEGGLPIDLDSMIASDKNMLKTITEEEKRNKSLQDQLKGSLSDLDQLLRVTTSQITELVDKNRKSSYRQQSLTSQIETWNIELESLRNNIDREKVAHKDLKVQMNSLSKQEQILLKSKNETEAYRDTLEHETSISEFNKVNKRFQDLVNEVNVLASRSGNIDTEIPILEEQNQTIHEEIGDIKERLKQRELDIAASTANQNEKRTSIDTLSGKAKELDASDKTVSEKISSIEKMVTEIQEDIRTQRRTIRGINSNIQSEIERVTRDQTRLDGLKENIGEIEEKAALFEEMDIPLPPESFSIEQTLKTTTELQIQMDQLQPVNRKAIKQYDIESQKNKRLTTQRSKIMAERNSIQEFMER